MKKKILIAESEKDLVEALYEQLKLYEEFDVTAVSTSVDAQNAIREINFDVLIIDRVLTMPEGANLYRNNFFLNKHTPIIVLVPSAGIKNTSSLKNDVHFIVKPFRLRELKATLDRVITLSNVSESQNLKFGPFIFRPSKSVLTNTKTGKEIRLTEKEVAILSYLLMCSNTTTGRSELLNEVWGYNSGVTTHTLETHVYRLRQKLEADPSNASILVTEPGGYRIIA